VPPDLGQGLGGCMGLPKNNAAELLCEHLLQTGANERLRLKYEGPQRASIIIHRWFTP